MQLIKSSLNWLIHTDPLLLCMSIHDVDCRGKSIHHGESSQHIHWICLQMVTRVDIMASHYEERVLEYYFLICSCWRVNGKEKYKEQSLKQGFSWNLLDINWMIIDIPLFHFIAEGYTIWIVSESCLFYCFSNNRIKTVKVFCDSVEATRQKYFLIFNSMDLKNRYCLKGLKNINIIIEGKHDISLLFIALLDLDLNQVFQNCRILAGLLCPKACFKNYK